MTQADSVIDIDPSKVFALDIETSTETIEFDGDPAYNPGLDPIRGFITEIALGTDSPETSAAYAGEEASILRSVNTHLALTGPGLITTWNGGPFDLPFIATRVALTSPLGIEQYGLRLSHRDDLHPKYDALPGHGPDEISLIDGVKGHTGVYDGTWQAAVGFHVHLDIAYAYKPFAEERDIPWRLKDVCEALGVEMIRVDREKMHLLSEKEREAYVLSDTYGTRLLALNALGLIDLGWRPQIDLGTLLAPIA